MKSDNQHSRGGTTWVVSLSALLTLFLTGMAIAPGYVVSPIPELVQDQEPSETEAIKQDARRAFMRSKLTSNQQIVEGLSLKDFDLIREGAQGVSALVKGQHWFVLETEEYQEHTVAMKDAADRLQKAAVQENIDAAALRYFDLTLTCIDCHQYLETMGK